MRVNLVDKEIVKERLKEKDEKKKLDKLIKLLVAKGIITKEDLEKNEIKN